MITNALKILVAAALCTTAQIPIEEASMESESVELVDTDSLPGEQGPSSRAVKGFRSRFCIEFSGNFGRGAGVDEMTLLVSNGSTRIVGQPVSNTMGARIGLTFSIVPSKLVAYLAASTTKISYTKHWSAYLDKFSSSDTLQASLNTTDNLTGVGVDCGLRVLIPIFSRWNLFAGGGVSLSKQTRDYETAFGQDIVVWGDSVKQGAIHDGFRGSDLSAIGGIGVAGLDYSISKRLALFAQYRFDALWVSEFIRHDVFALYEYAPLPDARDEESITCHSLELGLRFGL